MPGGRSRQRGRRAGLWPEVAADLVVGQRDNAEPVVLAGVEVRLRIAGLGPGSADCARSEPCSLALLLVVWQHSLRPLDAMTERVLKRGVTFALLDVLCDRRADYVRNPLTVYGRDRVQLL